MKRPTPKDVQQLIDEQVRSWARMKAVRIEPTPEPRPVVTVSREMGSQGGLAATIVAERLGFRVWGRELVDAIADETGLEKTLLASLDEKARSLVDDFVSETLRGTGGAAADYAGQVVRIVGTLARHGGAVFVGRGAQFVVDPAQALRVRVVSPLEVRIASLAERRGIEPKVAEREIARTDRDRLGYLRRYHVKDPDNPAWYDLVVNTGSLGPEKAADVILAAWEAKFGRPSG